MPALTIPKSSYAAFQHLIRFDAHEFEAFLDALSKAEPSLDQDNFWKHVAAQLGGADKSVIKTIVQEIFDMHDAISHADSKEIAAFVGEIAEAAFFAKSEQFPFEEGDKKILKDRLIRIFEGRKGLNITMKAMGVLTDQDHLFLHARIMTDVRPVFNERGDSVDAAVIVHNLRIHYSVDSDHKDIYFAMDTNDIQSLRAALDRADVKAKCLQGLLKTSGVSYLDAEE
jgi:hypothetical protein